MYEEIFLGKKCSLEREVPYSIELVLSWNVIATASRNIFFTIFYKLTLKLLHK